MLYDLSNSLARDALSRADLGQCRGWAALGALDKR